MIISVASGKGGLGKTLVATSMALSVAAEQSPPPLFLDCDAEEPNVHLFLHPMLDEQQDVALLIPFINEAKCTHCGKCADVCQYHAIAILGQKTLVFEQLCHDCGSCTALCPEKAFIEIPNRMSVIERDPAMVGIFLA
jgi:MinD superfamily P-loop ATPase